MADLTRLRARISLDAGELQRGLRQASAASSTAGRRIASTLESAARRSAAAFATMARGIGRSLTGLGGLLAGAGVVAGFQSLAASIDRVAKSANALGVSVPVLQALTDAAGKSGVSAEGTAAAFKAFQLRSGQAAAGTGELAAVLAELSINAQEFADLPLEQRLGVFADALRGVEGRANQTRVAAAAFGRSGADLLPLLDQGSVGIRQLGADFAATGAAISTQGAAGVEVYNDSMQDLRNTLQGLVQTLVVELAPGLADIVQSITAFITPINDVRKALVEDLGDALLRMVYTVRAQWNDLVASVLEGVAKVNASTATLTGFLVDANTAAADLNRATRFERRAAELRRESDQLRQSRDQLGANREGMRAQSAAAAAGARPNPLAGVGSASVVGAAAPPPAASSSGRRMPDLSGIRSAVAGIVASSTGLIGQLAGVVAAQLQAKEQAQGVVQGVDTAFGTFRTGEQVTLLRGILEASERTADAVAAGGAAGGGALT